MFIGTFGSRILGFVGTLLTLVAGAALAADSFANSVPTLVCDDQRRSARPSSSPIVKAMARSDGGQDF